MSLRDFMSLVTAHAQVKASIHMSAEPCEENKCSACPSYDDLLLELISAGGALLLSQKEAVRGRLPLHVAIEHGISTMVILRMLEMYPKAVFATDDDGWTVFIYAARFNSSIEVFRELMKIGPEKLNYLHSTGNSALHNAIFSSRAPCELLEDAKVHTSDELIIEMITVAPQLCSVKGAIGFYPLHYAAAYGKMRSIGLVKRIYEAFPSAALAQQKEGNLPLHLAIKYNAPFDVVEFLVNANPKGVFTANYLGELPLHFAGYYNASIDNFYLLLDADLTRSTILTLTKERVSILTGSLSHEMTDDSLVLEIVSLAPSLCMIRGANGNFPLHDACEHNASFEVVQRILSLNTVAAREFNKQRLLPIQLLVAKAKTVKWDIVRFLMSQYEEMPSNVSTSFLHSCLEKAAPDDIILELVRNDHLNIAVTSFDTSGRLALQIAVEHRASVQVIAALLQRNPDALLRKYDNGNSILHSAIIHQSDVDNINFLIQLYPQGVAQQNNAGDTPVRLAGCYNSPLGVVRALYEADKYAILITTNDGRSGLSGALGQNASDHLVLEFLDLAPSLCSVRGANGAFPLHIAVENSRSVDLISRLLQLYPQAIKEREFKLGYLPIQFALSKPAGEVDWSLFLFLWHQDPPLEYCDIFNCSAPQPKKHSIARIGLECLRDVMLNILSHSGRQNIWREKCFNEEPNIGKVTDNSSDEHSNVQKENSDREKDFGGDGNIDSAMSCHKINSYDNIPLPEAPLLAANIIVASTFRLLAENFMFELDSSKHSVQPNNEEQCNFYANDVPVKISIEKEKILDFDPSLSGNIDKEHVHALNLENKSLRRQVDTLLSDLHIMESKCRELMNKPNILDEWVKTPAPGTTTKRARHRAKSTKEGKSKPSDVATNTSARDNINRDFSVDPIIVHNLGDNILDSSERKELGGEKYSIDDWKLLREDNHTFNTRKLDEWSGTPETSTIFAPFNIKSNIKEESMDTLILEGKNINAFVRPKTSPSESRQNSRNQSLQYYSRQIQPEDMRLEQLHSPWLVLTCPENALDYSVLVERLQRLGLNNAAQLDLCDEDDIDELASLLKRFPKKEFSALMRSRFSDSKRIEVSHEAKNKTKVAIDVAFLRRQSTSSNYDQGTYENAIHGPVKAWVDSLIKNSLSNLSLQ